MKQPSDKLLALINQALDTGIKMTELIKEVWRVGAEEGFTIRQIGNIVRPIARAKGLNKDQVYYLTHLPQLQEKSKEQYQELKSGNIPTNQYKLKRRLILVSSTSGKTNGYEIIPQATTVTEEDKANFIQKLDKQEQNRDKRHENRHNKYLYNIGLLGGQDYYEESNVTKQDIINWLEPVDDSVKFRLDFPMIMTKRQIIDYLAIDEQFTKYGNVSIKLMF
jgi:hypothetical protein